MNKKGACNTNLSSDGSVTCFLNSINDYSEEQVMEFFKSVYAASQERIAKGKNLVANDAYPYEEDLSKLAETFFI